MLPHQNMASLFTRASACSRFFFCWALPYLRKCGGCLTLLAARFRYMTSHDMLDIFPSQQAASLAEAMETAWHVESKKAVPSLGYAIWRVFWKKLGIVALLAFIAESLVGVGFFLMSLLIRNLVEGTADNPAHSQTEGLVLSGVFTAITILLVFIRHNYQLRNSTTFV